MKRWWWVLALFACDDGRTNNAAGDGDMGPGGQVDMGDAAIGDGGAGGVGGAGAGGAGGGAGGAGGAGNAAGDGGEPDPPDPPLLDLETIMARVNPFVGTGGFGFNYAAQTPAAQVPLGMVRLGPDTTRNGNHAVFHHFSGYHYDDPDVRGFSHTHFVGTGIVDFGNIRVLPWRDLRPDDAPGDLFTSLDKASEVARPGYYAARLPSVDVQAELTATQTAGVHRYTFGAGGRVQLLIDAAAFVMEGEVIDSAIQYSGATVEGFVTYRGPLSGRTRPFTLHFSARMSQTPAAEAVWDHEGVYPGRRSADGAVAGAAVDFDVDPGESVELRVGVSYIDLEQARQNRAGVDERSFDEVAEAAWDAWAALLGRVRIGGGTEEQQRIFYTALYHAYCMPTRLDEGGRYRGLDGEVHGTDRPYYTDLSLWDTFRTLHPWYTLVNPGLQSDVLSSLLTMHRDGGRMPRWPAALSYGGSMIGSSADLLFAGSALKGIADIDFEAAFDALLDHDGRGHIDAYLDLGYIPHENTSGSVSRTLEYAYGDWALANLAEHLDRPEAAELRLRQGHYANLFDPEQGYFAPRNADGSFGPVRTSVVYMTDGPYTEGSPWHWRFSAFHEPEGLVALHGGMDAFVAVLDEYFRRSGIGDGALDSRIPDIFYWHGNEPTLHGAYLWSAIDRLDDAANWIRAVQTQVYDDAPTGMPGNDDGGTLSSWFLFSALGFYPMAGSDQYLLGSPLFPIAEVETAEGVLTIRAPGASVERRYVRDVELDGAPFEGTRLRHADLVGGRTLYLRMTAGE